MVNNASKNEQNYFKKEVNQAKTTNRLDELLEYPLESDIELAITHNLIKNCPTTVKDYMRLL